MNWKNLFKNFCIFHQALNNETNKRWHLSESSLVWICQIVRNTNCQSLENSSACQCWNCLFIFARCTDRNRDKISCERRKEKRKLAQYTNSRLFDATNKCNAVLLRPPPLCRAANATAPYRIIKSTHFDITN